MQKNNILKDLIIMFVTENYKNYLKEQKLKFIEEKDLPKIIQKIYIDKKNYLKVWLKDCLINIQKEEYMGDFAFNNIILEIFQDNALNCKRLELEIIKFQKDNIN
jgi:hypothetical protein